MGYSLVIIWIDGSLTMFENVKDLIISRRDGIITFEAATTFNAKKIQPRSFYAVMKSQVRLYTYLSS